MLIYTSKLLSKSSHFGDEIERDKDGFDNTPGEQWHFMCAIYHF